MTYFAFSAGAGFSDNGIKRYGSLDQYFWLAWPSICLARILLGKIVMTALHCWTCSIIFEYLGDNVVKNTIGALSLIKWMLFSAMQTCVLPRHQISFHLLCHLQNDVIHDGNSSICWRRTCSSGIRAFAFIWPSVTFIDVLSGTTPLMTIFRYTVWSWYRECCWADGYSTVIDKPMTAFSNFHKFPLCISASCAGWHIHSASLIKSECSLIDECRVQAFLATQIMIVIGLWVALMNTVSISFVVSFQPTIFIS